MLGQVDPASGTSVLLYELLASLANLRPGVLRPLVPDLHLSLTSVAERLRGLRDDEEDRVERRDLQKSATIICVLLYQVNFASET